MCLLNCKTLQHFNINNALFYYHLTLLYTFTIHSA